MLRWALRRLSLNYVLYQEAEGSVYFLERPLLKTENETQPLFLEIVCHMHKLSVGKIDHKGWHQSLSLKSFERSVWSDLQIFQ